MPAEAKSSNGIHITVANFATLENGTTGTLTLTSEDTTFAPGAGITFTIEKEAI